MTFKEKFLILKGKMICIKCKIDKNIKNFYYRKNRGKYSTVCNSCSSKYRKTKRDKQKKFAIYLIKNLDNGKCYIGQTNHYERRLSQHFSRLKKGNHANSYLQNAYNKSGWFVMGIISIHSTQDELNKEEIKAIKKFNSNWKFGGYNLEPGGKYNTMTPETKTKISNTKKGSKVSKESVEKKLQTWTKTGKIKKVHCYDLKGNYLKSYPSSKEASIDLKVARSSIAFSCLHKRNCGGYQLSYEKFDKIAPYVKEKKKRTNARKIEMFTKNNEWVKNYPSIRNAAKENNINPSCISNNLKGLSKSAGGYTWKYEETKC